MMLLISTWLLLRNLRRAGTLKKRFLIMKFDPGGQAMGSWLSQVDALMMSFVPSWLSAWRVRSSTCEMAAIDAKASPRNPMVCSVNRSSALRILLVLWRSKARRASVSVMPTPLSMICISVRPASFRITWMLVAWASMAFSINSLTTEAGR